MTKEMPGLWDHFNSSPEGRELLERLDNEGVTREEINFFGPGTVVMTPNLDPEEALFHLIVTVHNAKFPKIPS